LSPEPRQEDERIFYFDYVPNDEVPKFYSFADALVHPSMAEGFRMTLLEAMACGTPVISSNRGSLPEVAGDAGILFDPMTWSHWPAQF
jgi:glycosyltransferase involved in cell wall biosynthesis